MAIAPKGLLRYYVLELLSGNPMSGSEIMNKIEEASGGLWRPSPGSIYPLLEWLRDKGYVKVATSQETGVKQYALTDKGRRFLEEQREVKIFLRKTWRFFAPHFLDLLYLRMMKDERRELVETIKYFLQTFVDLENRILEENSREYVGDIIRILRNAADELNEVKKKIGGV